MKKLVVVCQCVEVIALAVWVGGLAAIIAAVIPAAFNSPIPIETGGRLLMKTFHGYDRLVLVSAGALMLSMLGRGVVAKDLISGPEWALAGVLVTVAGRVTPFLQPTGEPPPGLAIAPTGNSGGKTA